MSARRLLISLFGLIMGVVSLNAFAHKESDAYLTLQIDPRNDHIMHAQWDIALRDLDFAIGIDTNHDGAITWGEVQSHRAAIESYALSRLTIKGDGLTCALQPTGQMIDDHTDGTYGVILFDAVCDKNIPSTLTVVYQLMYDLDPYHRGIVTIHAGEKIAGAVLGPSNPSASLNLRVPDRWGEFKSFVTDGIWHIWTGVDHILFLLSLLLPAVLVRRRAFSDHSPWRKGALLTETTGALMAAMTPRPRYRWEAATRFWPPCLDVIKVVSAFSLSHSVTLSLAVLGIVHVPSRLVESGIALSVMVAALNNLYPLVNKRVWLIAFAFGFIHGLGFASALSGLQLPAGAMAASLGGFSVGVEVGQEAIVLAFLPLAYLLRTTWLYQRLMFRCGSLLIVALAIGWFVQRAFDVLIPGFSAIVPS
ncbi:membrane protein [Dyella lipolytica]|uniref:HupE/UreJ family protein n=1 Tax=Dyella lipolytica TaxID=1867835 RepID=A0ABW8IXM0_9GAMM|nr:HupE/UreJ family protein [Dyella lipolytica]GLQ45953.1 membrane protein [Dyella lipolytica]